MKRAIHIRCTQHFLYLESHKKSLKQLHIIVCFSVLSIRSAFTIYQHILLTNVYLEEISRKRTISGTCTNNGSKIMLSTHSGRITFAWIWRLTDITFARRKSIRDRPFNLNGYGFLFRSEFFFRTTRELEYLFILSRKARFFFPEFNIRLNDKNSESD